MATHRIPIIGYAFKPEANVWAEPQDILGTNDFFDRLVVRFGGLNGDDATQPTAKAGFHCAFDIPKNFVDSANLIIIWASTKTTGNVVWDFDYRAIGGDDAESFDQTTAQQSVTVTDGAGSAIWERMVATVALTDANFAVDDHVSYVFSRDAADAADTLAGSALLFQLLFEYQDA